MKFVSGTLVNVSELRRTQKGMLLSQEEKWNSHLYTYTAVTNPNIYEQSYILVCDVQSSAASSSLHISCMASFYAPHSLLKTDITLQAGHLWTHGLLYSHQPRPLGAL